MRRYRLLVIPFAVILLASAAWAQRPDPFLGEWKLNLDRSRFPGPPPGEPHILAFSAQPDGTILGLVYALDGQGGRTAVSRIEYRYDGRAYQDHDAVTGAAKPNTLSFTRIDERTVEVRHSLELGARVYREIRRVAEDGRTMTFSMSAEVRPGQTLTVLQVFDRQ